METRNPKQQQRRQEKAKNRSQASQQRRDAQRQQAHPRPQATAEELEGDAELFETPLEEAVKSKDDLRAEEILRRAQEKEKAKEQSRKDSPKEDNVAVAFVKGTARELRAATWPTKTEILKWSLIVIATVAAFAIVAGIIDNFFATPVMYWLSSFNETGDAETVLDVVDIVLIVVMFISGLFAMVGVMLHQGGDTEGLSDSLAAKLTGGSGQAQKNLDRLTVGFIAVFVAVLLAMVVLYPQGTMSTDATGGEAATEQSMASDTGTTATDSASAEGMSVNTAPAPAESQSTEADPDPAAEATVGDPNADGGEAAGDAATAAETHAE